MYPRWLRPPTLVLATYLALLAVTLWVAAASAVPPPTTTAADEPPPPAAVLLRPTLQQVTAIDQARLDRQKRQDRQERQERRAEARAAARDAEREADPPAPPPITGDCSGLPADLTMVCTHESGGNPTAYNPTGCVGGCYGLFQMSGEYMDGWATSAGYPGYAYAGHWPADVQKAVALWMYNQPNGLEVYWCQWTTYC